MKLARNLLIAAFVLALPASVQAADDPVIGTWWNVKKTAQITIAPCGKSVCGRISMMDEPNKEDGTPKLDVNNEEESLQGRTIMGLQIIGGFEKEETGKWEDGDIYNPEDGKTYSSNLAIMEDGNLGVEGCILFFCQEQIWTPVKQ